MDDSLQEVTQWNYTIIIKSMKLKALLLLLAISVATTGYAENIYTFKVNGKPYYFTEDDMDKQFGVLFDELIQSRTSKTKYFAIWRTSYEKWKEVMKICPIAWKLYGTHTSDLTSNCPDGRFGLEDRGLDKDGKAAKGNPNDTANHAHRIAYLNGMFSNYISKIIIRDNL